MHAFTLAQTHTHIYTRAREPWHRAKHAKPAIKFLEHVPSCKYAARVLVFETHFTYLVSSPTACLEAVPLDQKVKVGTLLARDQHFYPRSNDYSSNEISIGWFRSKSNYNIFSTIISFIFSILSTIVNIYRKLKMIQRIINKLASKRWNSLKLMNRKIWILGFRR